jgi:uncharacterized small protein (DUF1192 family)
MRIAGMCINWKVVAGLAIIAIGVMALAPNLFLAALPLLIIAACPLSMLLMMRGMSNMNGMQSGNHGAMSPEREPSLTVQQGELDLVGLTREEQIAQLQVELARTQAQLDALAQRDTEWGTDQEGRTSAVAVREAEAVARAADERAQGV